LSRDFFILAEREDNNGQCKTIDRQCCNERSVPVFTERSDEKPAEAAQLGR